MLQRLLPFLLTLAGLAIGAGAGFALRPDTAPDTDTAGGKPAEPAGRATVEVAGASDFAKLNNQFVVPVVRDGKVTSLVVLSLGLEVAPGSSTAVYRLEPKLRDAFLQVLFDHANAGGFDGVFTEGLRLDSLRRALLETARMSLGDDVRGVVIGDIVRQDV